MCLAKRFALFLLLLFLSNDNLIVGMYDWSQTPEGQESQRLENAAAEKYRFGYSGNTKEEEGGERGLLGSITSWWNGDGDDSSASYSNVFFF
jgi:hypothetical protein